MEDILKIGVIGAESTGKTRLCEELAAHYQTAWVPEYAREYFNDSDIYNYTADDLVAIAKQQVELEDVYLKKANDILFCDTTLITLKIWAELEFESTPAFINDHLSAGNFHHYLVTDNDVQWMEDGQRQNKHSRDLILEMNLNEVKKLNGSYSIITGTNAERLQCAIAAVQH